MNHQEKEKIEKILAYEDKQIDVDVAKIISNTNQEIDEQTIQRIKEQLVQKRMLQYPIDDEKKKEQLKKYTQTFNKALQEEKVRKQREKYKLEKTKQKATKAYQEQDMFVEKSGTQKVQQNDNQGGKVRKTLLDMAKEFVKKVFYKSQKEENKENIKEMGITHKAFSNSLEPISKDIYDEKPKMESKEGQQETKEEQR